MAGLVSREDFERLRIVNDGLVLPGSNLIGGGVPAFVGRVTSQSSEIAVGHFLLAQPTFVLGSEVEGGGGTFSPAGASMVPVFLVGPGTPSTGDYLICKYIDNRWAAEKMDGRGGGYTGPVGTIPLCSCTPIPATLSMTSLDPNCNFQMFQSCSIRYQATPADYAPLRLPSMIYLSDESFPDPVAGGAQFRYYLGCEYNMFTLSRIYSASPYGSPFHDGILYTWVVGGYANTCDPFHLDSGTAFPGSDASCFVTIDGR